MNVSCFLISEISGEGTDQIGEEEREDDDGVKTLHAQFISSKTGGNFYFSLFLFVVLVERRPAGRAVVMVTTGGFW